MRGEHAGSIRTAGIVTTTAADARLAGLDLLAARCANLDPDTPTAAERLDVALGPELARKLVFALLLAPRTFSEHRPRSDLRAWALRRVGGGGRIPAAATVAITIANAPERSRPRATPK